MSKKIHRVFRYHSLTSDEVAADRVVRQEVKEEFPPQTAKLSNLEPPLSIETEKLRADKSGKPLSEILARLGIQ
jgi:hypothetical protein